MSVTPLVARTAQQCFDPSAGLWRRRSRRTPLEAALRIAERANPHRAPARSFAGVLDRTLPGEHAGQVFRTILELGQALIALALEVWSGARVGRPIARLSEAGRARIRAGRRTVEEVSAARRTGGGLAILTGGAYLAAGPAVLRIAQGLRAHAV